VSSPPLSALVVLRPDTERLSGHERITTENVASFVPPADAVDETVAFFEGLGFTASPPVGISFSIEGPQSLFETTFGTALRTTEEGGTRTSVTVDGGVELPLDRLPERIAGRLQAVTFTPPPAFGPTDF
jgi:hypothetical protein